MNEENKHSKTTQAHSDGSQSQTGKDNKDPVKQTEQQSVVEQSAWKKFLSKKWAFPAMYMGAAVIILGIMWTYQQGTGQPSPNNEDMGIVSGVDDPLDSEGDLQNSDALPVTGSSESMNWPVANYSELMVVRPFYDQNGSEEARQAAVIHYDDMYLPSTGVSLAMEDNSSFDVLAAMSGTVTRIETNAPLVGQLVEITHDNGMQTIYSSLSEISVQVNEEISQGQVIAQAGRNEIERDLGVHVNFEVIEEGQPVNPNQLIEVQSEEDAATEDDDVEEGAATEEENQDDSNRDAEEKEDTDQAE